MPLSNQPASPTNRRRAAYDPLALAARRRFVGLAGWFESGTGDATAHEAVSTIVPQLDAAGADVCVIERTGQHNFLFWRDAFRHALPWVAARTGLTTTAPEAVCAAAHGNDGSSNEVALAIR